MTTRILYVTNSRLPTERANGIHIVKTCEGLALAGADVELWHADRRQSDPELRTGDVLDHYPIAVRFPTRTIRTVDLIRYEPWFNGRFGPFLASSQYTLWGLGAARLARQTRPDFCYTIDTAVALTFSALGVPVVYEHHHPKRRRVAMHSLRVIGRRPANPGVVALSEMLRTELVDYGVPFDKTHVIRHAVDPELFENRPGRADSRRQLGLPVDRPIVGYVGRFQALGMEKGIPELIESVGRLPPIAGREPLLVCVGGPLTFEAQYRDLAARAGVPQSRLVFADRVSHEEVPHWIRAFDVAVVPFPQTNHYEMVSPLKLVEYLAAGACVMATDLPSIREEVDHGENAWLVPPGLDGMASGLSRLLRDERLRERLAANAEARVASRTWCARGDAIMQLAPEGQRQ